jgi:hypothetical protein
MAQLENYTVELGTIAALDTHPSLDPATLKGKFDVSAKLIQTWINTVLIPHINTAKQDKVASGINAPGVLASGQIYIRISA